MIHHVLNLSQEAARGQGIFLPPKYRLRSTKDCFWLGFLKYLVSQNHYNFKKLNERENFWKETWASIGWSMTVEYFVENNIQ